MESIRKINDPSAETCSCGRGGVTEGANNCGCPPGAGDTHPHMKRNTIIIPEYMSNQFCIT
jgi:hypothetical protein